MSYFTFLLDQSNASLYLSPRIPLSGVGGLLGGGGKVSPWLTPEISHQKMDVYNLLGSDNKLSVNSFDVSKSGRVVCGGERQTLFCVEGCED